MIDKDILGQMDMWDATMDRVESMDYGTEVIKPVVESFRETGIDMMAVAELEAFLDEMERTD